ncbi:hypothetical protein PENFLA_c045G06165 [Penicillium flavigenum]|uniref:Guanylate cyclase domain-containing protein n=1 Tax=Penicillium flavigenum TaxID=254877 RepID=A0A1V6SIS0_9EURO|nr:hypothetical protein PENFLA_c045G06165 [Penicillium flavigenum]
MSGIEILGVVASSLQIAEIGMQLSVKLCSFYRQIKDTNRCMESLSNDVSLTCSILHQLGVTLQQDDQTKICSVQAYRTAEKVLNEFEAQNLQTGKSRLRWEAHRLTIAFVASDLDVLKSNLERLKSTMLLMLNVILYAGQVRRQDEFAMLEKQQELIERLMNEKDSNEAKYGQLLLAFKSAKSRDNEGFQLSTTCKLFVTNDPAHKQGHFSNELESYSSLIQTLLHEIDTWRSNLEQARPLRIRNGLVNVHSTEVLLFQHTHGSQIDHFFGHPIFQHKDARNVDDCPAPNNTDDGQQVGSSTFAEEQKIRTPPRRKKRNGDSRLACFEGVCAPEGVLAIMFAGITNPTDLWELFPDAMGSSIRIYKYIIRRLLSIYGGYEVKTEGDTFMPPDILDQPQCRTIVDTDNNVIFRGLSVRIGGHWGEPLCKPDPVTSRMDYFGVEVNRAWRIFDFADGGQISVSSDFMTVFYHNLKVLADTERSASTNSMDNHRYGNNLRIRRELKQLHSQGFVIKDQGERKLKGLENPELLFLIYPSALSGRISEESHRDSPPTTTPKGKCRVDEIHGTQHWSPVAYDQSYIDYLQDNLNPVLIQTPTGMT